MVSSSKPAMMNETEGEWSGNRKRGSLVYEFQLKNDFFFVCFTSGTRGDKTTDDVTKSNAFLPPMTKPKAR